MQNSMAMFTFSVFDWKYPFWTNLVQKIKIVTLILKDLFISESCIEIKIELNFYFHTSFEAPQRSVKIKI